MDTYPARRPRGRRPGAGRPRVDTAGHPWTKGPRVSTDTPATSRRHAGAGVNPSAMPHQYPIADAAGVRIETCWDVPEMAELLGASDRTIRRRVTAGLWPHIRGKGGRVLFTREHVRLIVAAWNETHDYPAHEPARRTNGEQITNNPA